MHADFPSADFDTRYHFSTILTSKAHWLTSYPSQIAANIPIPLSTLAGQDLSELEEKAKAAADAMKKKAEDLKGDTPVVNADTKSESEDEEEQVTEAKHEDNPTDAPKSEEDDSKEKEKSALPDDAGQKKGKAYGVDEGHSDGDDDDEGVDPLEEGNKDPEDFKPSTGGDGGDKRDGYGDGDRDEPDDDLVNLVCLGLRVYTKTDAPAVVGGQLRHEMGLSFDGLAIQA